HDLPIATNPAMLATAVRAEVRGVVVDHFHIGEQAGAGVGALDEIVAENGVGRKAAVQNLAEDVDLVDAFAGETAFTEEVLIDVGDRLRVAVETGLSGIDVRKARAIGGLHTDADARLQDAVAFFDSVGYRVDASAIQGMRERGDEALGDAAGKLRVRI